jgi:hypothetical protein
MSWDTLMNGMAAAPSAAALYLNPVAVAYA